MPIVKALANQPNSSVNVASIGMPTNLRDLLNSKPDAHLASGRELSCRQSC